VYCFKNVLFKNSTHFSGLAIKQQMKCSKSSKGLIVQI